MSNCKDVHIVADVPFNWLNWGPGGVGLPDADIAAVASALMSPSGGLFHSYADLGFTPNDHGGQTAMYRLTIEGTEALPFPFLKRLALILKAAGPLARLHVAEARDIENDGEWEHLVAVADLSGAAS
jgi:hypothetical protein